MGRTPGPSENRADLLESGQSRGPDADPGLPPNRPGAEPKPRPMQRIGTDFPTKIGAPTTNYEQATRDDATTGEFFIMGLDLALGAFVLIWAIRGWFKGFVLQAIGLGALVGSIYLADPVRNALRPYAIELFPAIAAPVLDRLLWWGSAVGSFVVVSGLASWIVKLKRRRPYGEYEPNRTDQGAGFLLGGAKGVLVASFLAAALVKYLPQHAKPGGAIDSQARDSKALGWSLEYRPAEQIWESAPVQSIVNHIRRRGFWDDAEGPNILPALPAPVAETPVQPDPPAPVADQGSRPPADSVRTANRAPSLKIPNFRSPDPRSPEFLRDVDDELERLGLGSP
jgi:uncharacterized membrane protein required for colicin V production